MLMGEGNLVMKTMALLCLVLFLASPLYGQIGPNYNSAPKFSGGTPRISVLLNRAYENYNSLKIEKSRIASDRNLSLTEKTRKTEVVAKLESESLNQISSLLGAQKIENATNIVMWLTIILSIFTVIMTCLTGRLVWIGQKQLSIMQRQKSNDA